MTLVSCDFCISLVTFVGNVKWLLFNLYFCLVYDVVLLH